MSHFRGVTIDGVWIGVLDYRPLVTQLATTSNYGAIADLHTSQITTREVFCQPMKSSLLNSFLAISSQSFDCLLKRLPQF
jgi:hypothetical protein